MTEPEDIRARLNAVAAKLDPHRHEVAIAHLNDAIAAFYAVEHGRTPEFALQDALASGAHATGPRIAKVR